MNATGAVGEHLGQNPELSVAVMVACTLPHADGRYLAKPSKHSDGLSRFRQRPVRPQLRQIENVAGYNNEIRGLLFGIFG